MKDPLIYPIYLAGLGIGLAGIIGGEPAWTAAAFCLWGITFSIIIQRKVI